MTLHWYSSHECTTLMEEETEQINHVTLDSLCICLGNINNFVI